MQLKDAVESRKSVRKFHHKKPDWKKIIRAIDFARFAPSAGGNFLTRFILVSDKNKIEKLAEASQQSFVGDVDYVVLVIIDDSRLIQDYGDRGERYGAQQSGAAIQNFLLGLTEQGLVTTWVGHFYDEQVKKMFDIPSGAKVEALFPIGVEIKGKVEPKRKMKLDQILYYDKWKNKKMVPEVKLSREVY